MKPFKDCEFSAFISYAHADDEAWFDWVTQFSKELSRRLSARLRGIQVPRNFLSDQNGPVSGVLSDQLRKQIAASYAMIIVVHENYAQSEWCLKELEYFKSLFGDEGFRQRLYIVALSRTWMTAVERSPDWKRLWPNADQIWVPFFRREDEEKPVEIYLGREQVSPEFKEPFVRLCDDLVDKIRGSLKAGEIEAGPRVQTRAYSAQRKVLFGVTTPDMYVAINRLSSSLKQDVTSTEVLSKDALLANFPEFERADTLVLPFNDSQPLLPNLPGGHLALQRDAWLKLGKPGASLVWLDMRQVPAAIPATPEHVAFLTARLGEASTPDDLLKRIRGSTNVRDEAVRIYIESNQNELKLWEPLGEQIKKKWDEIVAGMHLVPPLYVRPHGLPVDKLDDYPHLDDADGVVLLWGKKTPRALVDQINKVEGKLSGGRDLAPGIVAYLMPPQQNSEQPVPAWGWKVLRFDAEHEQEIDVVKEEVDDLRDFLRKILARSTKRRAGAEAMSARAVN